MGMQFDRSALIGVGSARNALRLWIYPALIPLLGHISQLRFRKAPFFVGETELRRFNTNYIQSRFRFGRHDGLATSKWVRLNRVTVGLGRSTVIVKDHILSDVFDLFPNLMQEKNFCLERCKLEQVDSVAGAAQWPTSLHQCSCFQFKASSCWIPLHLNAREHHAVTCGWSLVTLR